MEQQVDDGDQVALLVAADERELDAGVGQRWTARQEQDLLGEPAERDLGVGPFERGQGQAEEHVAPPPEGVAVPWIARRAGGVIGGGGLLAQPDDV